MKVLNRNLISNLILPIFLSVLSCTSFAGDLSEHIKQTSEPDGIRCEIKFFREVGYIRLSPKSVILDFSFSKYPYSTALKNRYEYAKKGSYEFMAYTSEGSHFELKAPTLEVIDPKDLIAESEEDKFFEDGPQENSFVFNLKLSRNDINNMLLVLDPEHIEKHKERNWVDFDVEDKLYDFTNILFPIRYGVEVTSSELRIANIHEENRTHGALIISCERMLKDRIHYAIENSSGGVEGISNISINPAYEALGKNKPAAARMETSE
ncbi:MAG: hypothetical protein HOE90_23220 [Bacteriovoracaceae bacterium]|jgi:hypothetical protein|nr:hypothetical protein [Bacteriovoracaceae bacterium]